MSVNTKKTEQVEDKVVALASIAAKLHSVLTIAWGVSLAAKNAKVISAQAGDEGLGFNPITVFIDEISQQTINGVNEINHEALRLSKIAVKERRCTDAYNRFYSVIKNNRDARHIASLKSAMESVEKTMLSSQVEFKKSLNNLVLLLETMTGCMLSARSIASIARIVTSDAIKYKDKLKVVSEDLDEAATFISIKIVQSYQHLYNVNLVKHR